MFDGVTMEIFMDFLDRKIEAAKQELKEKGRLSDDKAIPILLKYTLNHVRHLEIDINQRFKAVDKRFEQVDKRFEQVDKRFDRVDERFEKIEEKMENFSREFRGDMKELGQNMNRNFVLGFGFVTVLITVFQFLGK